MLTTKQLQSEILRLKKEKDFCILAHAYMGHEILEVADFVGDSFGLSEKASKAKEQNLLMCGVRFMAETAKILSPQKRVYISNSEGGCPMAEQLSVKELKELKIKYPNAKVVAYINTTAALKTECDICVTSASALDIVSKLDCDEILFIPDCNLGSWVKEKVKDKNFHFISGGCPVHTRITASDVLDAKSKHSGAEVLVHPECLKEVVDLADYAGSTTGIINYAKQSKNQEFIIGTENNIVTHLQYQCPDKRFYPLSKKCVCEDMRLTTLVDIYNCLKYGGEEIVLDEQTRLAAKRSIDAMLELG